MFSTNPGAREKSKEAASAGWDPASGHVNAQWRVQSLATLTADVEGLLAYLKIIFPEDYNREQDN